MNEEKEKDLNESFRDSVKQYINYGLIFIFSVVILVIFPLFSGGSGVAITAVLPKTTLDWIIYVVTKVSVACMNLAIFHCFIQQGITNVQNHPRYVEAKKIIEDLTFSGKKPSVPISPHKWRAMTYGRKGTTLFITSILGVFALGEAILNYDLTKLLSYAVTVILGIVFGVLQMKKAEIYWTDGYYEYAKYLERSINNVNNRQQDL